MGIVRKMRFIETLREGERISEVYLCRHKQTAMTKAGKPYDSLTLQDKTGTLDAKIWDVSSNGIEEFDSLDYIYVMGDVTEYSQLRIDTTHIRWHKRMFIFFQKIRKNGVKIWIFYKKCIAEIVN